MMFSTFAEQRHFIYPTKDTYSGVILNGNMVAHAPDGLAQFLLEKTSEQRYIIDPLTHAFQHDPSLVTDREGNPKVSVQKLATEFGEPVVTMVGKRPLNPSDLSDADVFRAFVDGCLAFQEQQLADRMKSSKNVKYMPARDWATPYAVVAPYFFMKETTVDQWLERNVQAVKMALERKSAQKRTPPTKLFGAVVVSQGVILNRSKRRQIASALAQYDLDGLLLWVDDLNEHEAGSSELSGLLELARALRDGNANSREVINLHGSYFSVLATGKAFGLPPFTGVAHGPEFGEYRSVIPVGGGIPIARYYVPRLHSRLRYREAVTMFRAAGYLNDAGSFHKNVCNCAECRATIADNAQNFTLFGVSKAKPVKRGAGLVRMEYPITETKIRCLRHYLQNKRREYEFALGANKETILKELEQGKRSFEGVVGLDGTAHLDLWPRVLGGEMGQDT